jgi:uncharacterized protein
MRLSVEDIPKEGLSLELTKESLTIEGDVVSPEVSLASPLKAHLDIHRGGSDIFIIGSMTGDVLLVCSRCLGGFSYRVESAIDSMIQSGCCDFPQESELHRGELSASFSEEGIVDTDAILCEQLFLAIPIKQLCAPDCKGLCPDCGALLAESACDCADKVNIDPRLAVLKELKVDKK